MKFNEETLRLLDGTNVATVATLNPDGGPQTSVVWIVRNGDFVLFSTTARRQKARNLARDPRVSLTVFDAENSCLARGQSVQLPDEHTPGEPCPLTLKGAHRDTKPRNPAGPCPEHPDGRRSAPRP